MRCRTRGGITNVLKTKVVAAGLALLSTAAAAMDGELKGFGDWQAGCDNIKNCAALSLPREDESSIAYLRLERAAGPDASVKLLLRVLGDWKTLSTPLKLKLDDMDFPVTAQAEQSDTDSGTVSLTLQPAEIAAFLEASRKATKLTITAPEMTAEISLSGSVAAMLWIDEQQGRLDTTSALIRKGKGTNVPAAVAVPVITAKKASGGLSDEEKKSFTAALRQEILKPGSDICDDDEELAAMDDAWLLDGDRRLVGLACSRGAYNVTTGFWTVEGGKASTAKPVAFPEGTGDDTENMLVNAGFDSATGRLEFFSRGRGIGDCGVFGGFAWTGTEFVLTGLSMMGECRGIAPNDWVPLFSSEVK